MDERIGDVSTRMHEKNSSVLYIAILDQAMSLER